jgi:hypothetical protein
MVSILTTVMLWDKFVGIYENLWAKQLGWRSGLFGGLPGADDWVAQ